MKKLMIAAATAALAAGAFAGEPQAYEMTLTVKASVCATNKKPVETACGDIVAYRKQTTRKYKGIFWGCDCGVIACPTGYYSGATGDDVREYLFWSETKGFQYPLYLSGSAAGFQWTILQVVGPKAANVEGMWTLALEDDEGTEILNVQGAGYGNAQSACTPSAKITSMSGYLTGLDAAFSSSAGCLYCAEPCDAYEFCTDSNCSELKGQNGEAVLFGTWTLKYNSSIAKKLVQGKEIKDAYKFPKYVSEKLDAIAAITIGKSEKDKEAEQKEQEAQKIATLKAAYDEAKTALETAETELEEAEKALDTWNKGDAKTEGSKAKFEADIAAAKTAATTKAGEAQTAADNAKTALKGETVSGSKLGETYITNLEKVAELNETIATETDSSKVKAAQAELASYETALANTEKQIAALTGDTKTQFDKLMSDYKTTKAANETAQAEKAAAEKADADKAETIAAKEKELTEAQKAADKAADAAEEEVKTLRVACIAVGGDCL